MKKTEKEVSKVSKFNVVIHKAWCKDCGICKGFCPKDVFGMTEKKEIFVKPEHECIGCRMCTLRCPDFAVTVTGKGE